MRASWLLIATMVVCACGDDEPEAQAGDGGRREDASVVARADGGMVREDASTSPTPRDASTDASRRDAAASDASSAEDAATSGDAFASLRQACVDTINMYRATKRLPPIARASAGAEACSDEGAAYDSMRNQAHGSSAKNAIPCRTRAVAQNTCPNYSARNGSIEASMKSCLESMWNEGEPAEGIPACTKKYFDGDKACFLAHGHYINMVGDSASVSCGFFENDKKQWWMNQDFQ